MRLRELSTNRRAITGVAILGVAAGLVTAAWRVSGFQAQMFPGLIPLSAKAPEFPVAQIGESANEISTPQPALGPAGSPASGTVPRVPATQLGGQEASGGPT